MLKNLTKKKNLQKTGSITKLANGMDICFKRFYKKTFVR